MTPEAVIFDVGNVLTRWQPEAFYDRVIGAARRRALFAAVDLHHMNDLVDTGALFRETIYDWAERYPDWGPEIRLWYASKTIEHGFGKDMLVFQIETQLHKRQGAAITNFEVALPPSNSDLTAKYSKILTFLIFWVRLIHEEKLSWNKS